MSDIALTMVMLSLAGALGLWIGNVKIYRVSLGIGGVLLEGSLSAI